MNAQVKTAIQNFYLTHKRAVDELAVYLEVPPLWLVAVFHRESALNPQARNSTSGAVGLNQMMPTTLSGLGLTVANFQNAPVAQQLDVMKRFFEPIRGRVKRAGDLYLFNFLPAAVIENVGGGFVLGERGGMGTYHGISKAAIYEQNAALDYNHDGKITRSDFWDGFEEQYDEVVGGNFFLRSLMVDLKTHWVVWLLALLLIAAAIYGVLKINA